MNRVRVHSNTLNMMVIAWLGILSSGFALDAEAAPKVAPSTRVKTQAQTSAQPKKARPIPAKASPAPVLDNFAKARVFFANGQYEKSLLFAAADLRANPTRKASLIIMAQSEYRLGRAGNAAKLFSLLSPDDLSSEAAFEYTLAMFAAHRYRQATKVWQKVGPEHPYRDVARFYAGISYMQLNLYNKASQLLRGAIKLPANLKSERRRLIAELDDLQERQRRGDFTAGQVYAYQAQQPNYQIAPPVEAPPLPGAPPMPKKPASPPVVQPKAGFSFSATPSFSYLTKSIKRDFNGYTQAQGSSRSPVVTSPLQLKYLGKPRSFGGQTAFTLNVTPGYEDIEGTLTKSSLTAPSSDPSAVQTITDEKVNHSFNASLMNGFDILYPVSDAVDVGVGYKDEHIYVDASQKKEKAVSGPNAKAVIDGDLFKFELGFSMYDSANAALESPKVQTATTTYGTITRNGESSVTNLKGAYIQTDAVSKAGEKTRTSADLTWDKNWDDLTLGLLAGYVSKTVYPESVISDSTAGVVMDAARSLISGGGTLKWTLGFGLAMTGSFKHTEFSDYDTKIPAANKTSEPLFIASSGSINAFGLSGAVSIGPYVSVEAAYNYTDRKVNPGDEANAQTILKEACSQQTETSMKLGIRYPF